MPWERLTGERLVVYGFVWAELYLSDKGGMLKNTGFGVRLSDMESRVFDSA